MRRRNVLNNGCEICLFGFRVFGRFYIISYNLSEKDMQNIE